ncbi:MAG: hypothetical protein HYT70_03090 [Candidatus Aenigmarchaeota archaeon]|nr:hypothetical protein [Candidatus Aenigmarchaeota archaeon]
MRIPYVSGVIRDLKERGSYYLMSSLLIGTLLACQQNEVRPTHEVRSSLSYGGKAEPTQQPRATPTQQPKVDPTPYFPKPEPTPGGAISLD